MNSSQKNAPLDNRLQTLLVWLLRASLVVAAIIAVAFNNVEAVFMSVLAFGLTFVPEFIERRYDIHLPVEFDFIIVIFMYGAIFLGEVQGFYDRFWWWDSFLHLSSGVVLGFAGFLVLYVLYIRNKLKASPFLVAVFSFAFAMALGAIWEVFEFGMDETFGLNMQRGSLRDTMWDLIVNGIGALIISWAGYRLFKGKDWLIGRMIRNFLVENPRLRSSLEKYSKRDS